MRAEQIEQKKNAKTRRTRGKHFRGKTQVISFLVNNRHAIASALSKKHRDIWRYETMSKRCETNL